MEPRPNTAFAHPITVTWGDCDPARIVYTGRIPAMALEGINAWWDHTLGDGWYQMELDRNVGTPFVRLEMDLKHPITPRHKLITHIWPVALGTTSISFRVDGVQDGTTCFQGRFTCVFIEANAFRKCPPPPDIRAVVDRLMEDA